MVPPIIRRFPSSLLLALSLLTFFIAVLIFTLPFDVDQVGPTNATANCGPPVFEIGASEYAAPSTIVPPGTTIERRPPSPPTTPPAPFGIPITTASTAPGLAALEPSTTTSSTLDLNLVKQACGAPASKRFFLGGLGIVAALAIGYLARVSRSHKFGYVVR